MNKSKGSLIFVTGCPRSGTTLIQKCLNAHPDIYGGPEFDCMPDVIKLRNKLRRKVNSGRISAWLTAEEVDEAIQKFINDLLLRKTAESDVAHVSEKTPKNILVLSDLIETYPEASFLWVVRDPRAVYRSMKAVRRRAVALDPATPFSNPGHFLGSLYSSVRYIQRCFDSGFEALERHPRKVKLIKYESFVTQPEKGTKSLCSICDVEWNENMLYPDKTDFDRAKGAEQNNPWYPRKKFDRGIESGEIEKWRRTLKRFEINYINNRTKGHLDHLGYPIERPIGKHIRVHGYKLGMKVGIRAHKTYRSLSRVLSALSG